MVVRNDPDMPIRKSCRLRKSVKRENDNPDTIPKRCHGASGYLGNCRALFLKMVLEQFTKEIISLWVMLHGGKDGSGECRTFDGHDTAFRDLIKTLYHELPPDTTCSFRMSGMRFLLSSSVIDVIPCRDIN